MQYRSRYNVKLISEKQTLQKPTVATIGFFDGVHKGHQFLLTELIKLAQKKYLESLVVTFRNSPQTLLHPEKVIKNLTTPPEKTALLEKLGISNCLLLDFNEKIATQKAKVFLTWLKENYGVQTLLIGYDHHFGADRLTSFTAYQAIGNELDIEILQCPKYDNENQSISSSKIRTCLNDGAIETANHLLGYNYTISGKVVHGEEIGRKMGIPTANIITDTQKLIPKKGVYVVEAIIENQPYQGLLNIGIRPTVNGQKATIETHFIDFKGNLYGKELTLHLKRWIRSEIKFSSIEALRQQIELDKNQLKKPLL